MIYKCRDIAGFIKRIAPPELAEDWDNVGMLLGSPERDIRTILLCMDITAKTVEEAIGCNADMILSHHPLIFRPLKSLNEEYPKAQIISKLIRSNICVYSAHTNLDAAVGGVNDRLAQVLELQEIDSGSCIDKEKFVNLQYGKIGVLKNPIELNGFISMVKDRLNTSYVRVIGYIDRKVEKVAVFSGSFDEGLFPLSRDMADVLVTGDIKYHTALDLLEAGLCVIDAGHFNTEKIVLPFLASSLKEQFPGIGIVVSNVEEDPFKVS